MNVVLSAIRLYFCPTPVARAVNAPLPLDLPFPDRSRRICFLLCKCPTAGSS
jgi:hypothetical protein